MLQNHLDGVAHGGMRLLPVPSITRAHKILALTRLLRLKECTLCAVTPLIAIRRARGRW
jgi:hypothetical protein